jgi:hypothetical protein
MAITVSCDGEGCPSRQLLHEADPWLVVHPMGDTADTPGRHYCSRECAAMDLAGFEVPETMSTDGGQP